MTGSQRHGTQLGLRAGYVITKGFQKEVKKGMLARARLLGDAGEWC